MQVSDLLLIIVVTGIFIIFATAAIAGFKAAPYVPTFQRDVRRMLRLAKVMPGELVVDLGAGDGRYLLTAANEFQARGQGYEMSILPYLIARLRIGLSPQRSRLQVQLKDFFHQDLSPADVVTCFLTPMAMKKLEPKIARELKPGARVVSFAFKLPTRVPTMVDKPTPTSTPIFLYVIPPGT